MTPTLDPSLGRRPGAHQKRSFLLHGLAIGAALFGAGCSSDSDEPPFVPPTVDLRASLLHWSRLSVDATGLDHAPPSVGPPHVQGEQLGPCRSARAMAIVHIALFEAMNAIEGGYESYVGLAPAPPSASVKAAIAQSVHDTLAALFPSQAQLFAEDLAKDLATVPDGTAKVEGIAVGSAAASAILALRAGDGSDHPEPVYGVDYIPSDDPGRWRQDPISQIPVALGANWGTVQPFVIDSADQFRAPAPPSLDSPEYTLAYNEALVLGGDGVTTPTARSEQQTEIGIYWAYDGTPSLCAPPRLYNQIVSQIAREQDLSLMETARLLARVNVALADTAIAVWDSKYHYDFWRPVTAIREADPGTGPSGLGDGNPATIADLTYTPLGAPASNLGGVDFTPPFPSYPSGHAGFGGALFEALRNEFGSDEWTFEFQSDELNGVTTDSLGNVRPAVTRTFQRFSEAEEENSQSRIYLGIHWNFDKASGSNIGNQVADVVYERLFPPVP